MSFAKHSLQTILVRFCQLIFVLLTGIITARWLGPEGEGVLVLLILVKNFAFRFGNLGFGSAFAFYAAKHNVPLKRILKMLWLTGISFSAISVVVLLLVWKASFSPWNDLQPGYFYISLIAIPPFFLNTYLQRLLSGQLRIAEMNTANLIMNSSILAFMILLVIAFKMEIKGAILAVVLADMVTLIYLWIVIRRTKIESAPIAAGVEKEYSIYDFWRYGKWNYLLMFANFFIEELPLILLKKTVTGVSAGNANASLGFFSKARGLGRQSRIVALPVAQVLFPYTAASKEHLAIKRTNTLSRNYLLIMIPIALVMVLCIKPVIYYLYGSSFLPAVKVFYALAPGICLWPYGHFLGVHVAASGKPKIVFFSSCIILAVAIVICWLLIPAYGAFGAGLSVSVIYFVQAIVRVLVYKKVTGASLKELLVFHKDDLKYYNKLLSFLKSKLQNKTEQIDE
jgi:O-antigen/teichoic acid export membrane protein